MSTVLKNELPELKLNGSRSDRHSDSNWRERAINRALLVEARDGDGTDVLVAAARANLPGCVTLTQWLDVERVLAFLREHTSGARSLLAGEDLFCESDSSSHELHPHTYWYAARWRGAEIELATRPSGCRYTFLVAVAQSVETAQALSEALADYALRPNGRCLKYAGGWECAPEMEADSRETRWEDVILAPEVTTMVRESVEGFIAGKAAYEALGFPWRRGILLVGPPGTGKTMLCKAAAASLPDWPLLYVRNLCRNDRESFREIFARARKLSPCLLVLEDIDGLVTDQNRTIFLNEMDGFRSNDGLLILASSNHPEKIDEALLKRPSRFDRVVHVGLPKKPERAEYCRQLLSRGGLAAHLTEDLDVEDLAEKAASRSDGFTPAYLKEAFTAAALGRAHSGAMTLDAAFAEAVLAEIATLKAQIKRSKDPESMGMISGGGERIGFRRTE